MAVGRTHSIQEAASASAWGARSAMARNLSCGTRGILLIRGRRFIEKLHSVILSKVKDLCILCRTQTASILRFAQDDNSKLFENPVLGGRAQRIQSLFAACFAINAHNRFCP